MEKFQKLWIVDISNYPSQSEVDLGFVSILVFYCNGNKEQIERMFSESALFRGKWDERYGSKIYGEIPIGKVLSGMKNIYFPIISAPTSEDFDVEITELNTEIIQEFIDRIIVFKAEKVNGRRQQKIQIIYNSIGAVDLTASKEKMV